MTTSARWKRVRKSILERDGEACVRCHHPACDVHHRKLKGMGGTSDEEVAFGPQNLISLCRECHSYVHQHPAYAYENGYLVHSWDTPELVKIITNLGILTITPDGTSAMEACECFLHHQNAARYPADKR